ncbi:MAG: globin [Armatimonadetes bacterium]|nr:globin [Armatimonadota bacterium]
MSDTTQTPPPSLYEWAGGMPAFERLTTLFYQRVATDEILQPVFADMNADHPRHVALFIAEVFGGPTVYGDSLGGHAGMIEHHLNRHLTQTQRRRWLNLLLDCADEAGLPDDPEFRSAFVGYLEWGTRLAVINSQDGVVAPGAETPMPQWNWGAVGGPYQPS